jgi:hypothetical protein|tara:strand:- start:14 stop:484 length:471 start_codon:yes stop_codon:yes gene_type:complete
MINKIYQFNYSYDRDKLLLESSIIDGYKPYYDPKNDTHLDLWTIKRITEGYGKELSQTFSEILECNIKPRFYIQKKGYTLPLHTDRGTLCSINFVLSDSKNTAVSFEDGEVIYSQALLNTTIMHGVINPQHDRHLFKMSIFDKTFGEVREIISSRL